MEAGGRILSRLYTVKELHDGALNEIPETSGVYFVFMPSNFELGELNNMWDIDIEFKTYFCMMEGGLSGRLKIVKN